MAALLHCRTRPLQKQQKGTKFLVQLQGVHRHSFVYSISSFLLWIAKLCLERKLSRFWHIHVLLQSMQKGLKPACFTIRFNPAIDFLIFFIFPPPWLLERFNPLIEDLSGCTLVVLHLPGFL